MNPLVNKKTYNRSPIVGLFLSIFMLVLLISNAPKTDPMAAYVFSVPFLLSGLFFIYRIIVK